jgi:hypothetical protein
MSSRAAASIDFQHFVSLRPDVRVSLCGTRLSSPIWLRLEPFEHVRDSIGVAVVGAVVSPHFREAEAAKDGNRTKRSDRRQSRHLVRSGEIFDRLVETPGRTSPAMVRVDVELVDFAAVKVGPTDYLSADYRYKACSS